MAEILTAEMARFSLGCGAEFPTVLIAWADVKEALKAIADGRHVVVEADEYAALLQHSEDYANLHARCFDAHNGDVFEALAELDSGLSSTVAERDQLRQRLNDSQARHTIACGVAEVIKSERARLAGINRQMFGALTELVRQHDEGFWSSWQTTAHFVKPLDDARAAIAAATRGREE